LKSTDIVCTLSRTIHSDQNKEAMDLLAEFRQYEKSIQSAKAAYLKYEKLFLAAGDISIAENKTLNQLSSKVKLLEDTLEGKKLEQAISYVKKEVAQGDVKSTVEALHILGNILSQVSVKCKVAANPQLEAIYATAKPVLAKLSSVKTVKIPEHDCGDHWIEGDPLARISFYSPSCKVQFANLDLSSRAPYVGEWIRENASKALFESFSKELTYRVDRIFKTPEWLGTALGLTETDLQEYTGLRVRYRIKGETILLHNWYGKYKYNFWTRALLAVDFKGKGADQFVLAAPFILEYGLFDHDGVLVGSFEEKGDKTIGIDIDSYTVLPERNVGTF
jgi:hypothetical protein